MQTAPALPEKWGGRECGSGGGRRRGALRSVPAMSTPGRASLQSAESDLQIALSEADPHRQGQYARSAADTAAEVALDNAMSRADRALYRAKDLGRDRVVAERPRDVSAAAG